jgi:hypothetical protein
MFRRAGRFGATPEGKMSNGVATAIACGADAASVARARGKGCAHE